MTGTLDFLSLLEDEDRRALEGIGTILTAPKGRILLAHGQIADKVLIVRAGRVKIVGVTSGGHQIVLAFRGPGALVGEQALVDGTPRAANVLAIEPVESLTIAASAFRAFLERRPRVALALLEQMSLRLRDADRRLAEFASADTLGRVAARLVELCEQYGEEAADGAVTISLPLTQEDLAGWIGASLEATAKSLRQLRELGWVATGRRAIVVHDLEAMRARAG